MTRRYGKPVFGLHTTSIGGEEVPISEEYVWTRPFCKLLRFKREFSVLRRSNPSAHLARCRPLCDAVARHGRSLLPSHDVYVTDWTDARAVPMSDGHFDLDDYIDYLIEIMTHLSKLNDGAPLHTWACARRRSRSFAPSPRWRPRTIRTRRNRWC